MATRKIEVAIVGDSRSLERTFGRSARSASNFGDKVSRGFRAVGKAAAFLTVAAGAGLAAGIAFGTRELMEQERVSAQTAAALKSTGNAANITRPQVEALASAIQAQSGLQDDVVQSGANMLLTFTRVRNEAGKGNNIFDQSLTTLADMSVAMGKSMPKSAVMLGKALNDPIKGITALTRVGVTFTDAQKDQIKALAESGDVMGAQKIILAELNKEFGGSAKAFGNTTKGRIEKIKRAFEDVTEALAANLLPTLTDLLGWVATEGIPLFDRFANAAIPKIRAGFEAVANAVRAALPTLQSIGGWLRNNRDVVIAVAIAVGTLAVGARALVAFNSAAAAIQAATVAIKAMGTAMLFAGGAVVAIALIAGGLYLLYQRSATARRIIDASFKAIKAAGIAAFDYLRVNVFPVFVAAFQRISAVVRTVVGIVMALWRTFGADIVRFAKTYFNAIAGVVRPALQVVAGIVKTITALIRGDWSGAWEGIKQIVSNALRAMVAMIRGTISVAVGAARLIGTGIVKAIFAGLRALGTLAAKLVSALVGAIASAATAAYNLALSIGHRIVDGVLSGVGGLGSALKSKVESLTRSALSSLNPFSPVEHGGEIYIGKPIVEGAAKGIQRNQGKLKNALSGAVVQAIMDAKANLGQLGSSLGSMVGEGIDARTSKRLSAVDNSPEAIRLRQIEDEQRKTQAIRERARLDDALKNAKTAKDRQEAQEALDDFLLQQEAETLNAQLEQRRATIQAEEDARKESVQRGIADLTDSFNRGLISQKEFSERLKTLLASNEADFGTIGSTLGGAFQRGFEDALAGLLAQLKALAEGPQAPNRSGSEPDVKDPFAVQFKEWDDKRKELAKAKADAIADAKKKSSEAEEKTSPAERKRIETASNRLEAHLKKRPKKFALGGIVDRPTFGVFGEAGREALVPLDNRRAGLKVLAEAARELGASPSNGPLVHVETMVVQEAGDVDRFAARIGRQLAMRAA